VVPLEKRAQTLPGNLSRIYFSSDIFSSPKHTATIPQSQAESAALGIGGRKNWREK